MITPTELRNFQKQNKQKIVSSILSEIEENLKLYFNDAPLKMELHNLRSFDEWEFVKDEVLRQLKNANWDAKLISNNNFPFIKISTFRDRY